MGINANKYTILGGAATIDKCYLRVRDFKNNKSITNTFTFQYSIEVLVNDVLVFTDYKVLTNPKTTESDWKMSYDHLKADLTKQGITFTDKI